ncbi:MAG TPA: IS1182 family transposase [Candidatus Acidoferrales bacterium]|nr:IS1182 family transposase [Candidatus Acidoferrales bacterium]
MLLLIAILGGLLFMMGQHDRSESLFYYFRLEDHIPENHLLRLIDRHVDFSFVRKILRESYSETGRPSVDPEVLLRILLIGYLYGITSERKLIEELRMHLAWRWFTGLGFDQEIPHHSTFSKNRHGRFQESGLFQELFERIVDQCVHAGLVQGEHMSVDGSFIQADATNGSRIPREQLAEAAQVNRTVREFLAEVEEQNRSGEPEPVHEQEKVSTTDPDATYFSKGNMFATLGYFDNYLVDNASCVIVGVKGTGARMSQESASAREMIFAFHQRYGHYPQSLAADTAYGNAQMLHWLLEREITPYMPVKESPHPDEFYGIDKFTYEPECDRYICPQGKTLNHVHTKNNRDAYHSTEKKCRNCPIKSQCTAGQHRVVSLHVHDEDRRRTRALAKTPEYAKAVRARRKVEALFAELKNRIGLRRLRLRRMKFVREQFYLAAAVQNMKRLVRYLAKPITPPALATA